MEKNAHGSLIINSPDGEPLDSPTEVVTLTLILTVEAKLATTDCEGNVRPDLREALAEAIIDAVINEMPYKDGDRESTDLVQEVMSVDAVIED